MIYRLRTVEGETAIDLRRVVTIRRNPDAPEHPPSQVWFMQDDGREWTGLTVSPRTL